MKLADLENSQFGTRIWDIIISYTGRVISNFVFKYPNFCHNGNRGPSETSCNDAIKLADPETHFGTKIWELYPMETEL